MPYPEYLVAPMREELTSLGVKELKTSEAVNDHPRFIEALADVVSESVARYGRGRPLSIVPAEPPAKRELPPPVKPAAAT